MTSSIVHSSSPSHRKAQQGRGVSTRNWGKVISMGTSRTSGGRKVTNVIASLLVGFALTTWLRMMWVPPSPGSKSCDSQNSPRNDPFLSTPEPNHPSKNLLMVGVMTAAIFLETRAVAVNRTWAQTIPGQVAFFSSGASSVPSEWNLPVISLPGVTDAYPPQKKSFMMLKYMHDNFIDKYEWFMRADDDVYIRGDRMETFLRSLNSSHTYFIGQAGRGKVEELGLLHLEYDDNFCMGGTGMVFSRATLRKMVPHVSYCLKNLWSTHEDVEVGRCVKKFVGIDCTWSYEVRPWKWENDKGSTFPHHSHHHHHPHHHHHSVFYEHHAYLV